MYASYFFSRRLLMARLIPAANLFKAQLSDGALDNAIIKETGLPDGTFRK